MCLLLNVCCWCFMRDEIAGSVEMYTVVVNYTVEPVLNIAFIGNPVGQRANEIRNLIGMAEAFVHTYPRWLPYHSHIHIQTKGMDY